MVVIDELTVGLGLVVIRRDGLNRTSDIGLGFGWRCRRRSFAALLKEGSGSRMKRW